MLFIEAVAEGAKCKQLEKFVIGNDEEKFFQVGAQLPPREKEELIGFLRKSISSSLSQGGNCTPT